MKKLDLTTYGVEEMNEAQMKQVDGGSPIWMYNEGTFGCWLYWGGDGWYYAPGSEWYVA